MIKALITIAAVCSGLSPLSAGQLEDLRAYSFSLPPLSAAAALPAPAATADPVLNALSDAQWENLLSRPTYEETLTASGQNKELYSDFHTRYIVKGKVSFASNPPLFSADTGRVFKVVKYPDWLKSAGAQRLCVEAYLRQRENTAEMLITKMLPADALDDLMPSATMQDLQRDPYFIAKGPGAYSLGNVSWKIKHDAAGARVKDQYGNFITEWQDGVKIDPSQLVGAYFVKKNMLKPVKVGDHGLLMFRFKPGGVTAPDGSSTRMLVVSLDAYYKDQANMTYSQIDALKGKYLVYYSVQSAERYSELKLAEAKASFTLYPLKLDAAQLGSLLATSLGKATDINKGEVYSLFYNSCANSALSLINTVLPEKQKVKAGWLPEIFYRVRTTFPDAIAATLIKKGAAGPALPEVTSANFAGYYSF